MFAGLIAAVPEAVGAAPEADGVIAGEVMAAVMVGVMAAVMVSVIVTEKEADLVWVDSAVEVGVAVWVPDPEREMETVAVTEVLKEVDTEGL